MKKFLVTGVMTIAIAFSGTSAKAIPVIDVSAIAQMGIELGQAIKQFKQQVEQYKKQLDDLELQVKNTLTPDAWLWDQIKQTIDKVLELQGQINYYNEEYGRIQAYLDQYKDYEYYEEYGDNFTNLQGEFSREQRVSLGAQNSAYDSFMTSSDVLSQEIETVSDSLNKLRGNTKDAEGQMQAIQSTNQYLDLQSQQLTQLQTAVLAQSRVVAEEANYQRMQREQEDINNKLLLSGEYQNFKTYEAPNFGHK